MLCHVGMFAPVKNHEFLIDIFASVVKKHPDSVLLLVGTGSETEKIRDLLLGRQTLCHLSYSRNIKK